MIESTLTAAVVFKEVVLSMLKKFSIVDLYADVKLPAVLSDNMVLQQQSNARFWGWATPGEKVEVKGSWAEALSEPVTADKDGKWKMSLKTPKAGGAYRNRRRPCKLYDRRG